MCCAGIIKDLLYRNSIITRSGGNVNQTLIFVFEDGIPVGNRVKSAQEKSVMIQDPVLLNDWFPVLRSDALTADKPVAARLLGVDLVLWRRGW